MKLNSLYVRNFKLLEDFSVRPLGNVNLIVGGNNSGKSTVLEALKIYASDAHPSILFDIATTRGEIPETDGWTDNLFNGLNSFFTQKKIFNQIEIGKNNESYVKIESGLVRISEEEEKLKDQIITKKKRDFFTKSAQNVDNTNDLNKSFRISKKNKENFFIDEDYSFRVSLTERNTGNNFSYIPTGIVSIGDISGDWDRTALTEHETIVSEFMKIIEPKFDSLAFINMYAGRYSSKFPPRRPRPSDEDETRVPIVKLSDIRDPVPLKSMGDGMLRILQLALKLPAAKDGFLLIDEFENGLHWSVQEKVWDMIFTTAKQYNIQVFATTHSLDCVKAFAKVATARQQSEGVLLSMGRSPFKEDNNKVVASIYDESSLDVAIEGGLELR